MLRGFNGIDPLFYGGNGDAAQTVGPATTLMDLYVQNWTISPGIQVNDSGCRLF